MTSFIVLAAGKSTRMKSELNKHLQMIGDKTVIVRIIETIKSINPDHIVVVVGHQKEKIIEALRSFSNILFVHQKEQLGTGHAVLSCANEFEKLRGSVFILPGDTPFIRKATLEKMKNYFQKLHSLVTLLAARCNDPASYGRVILNKEGSVDKIVEARDATRQERAINLINAGIYLVDISFLFEALEKISNNNVQGEYYLTDIIAQAAELKRVSYIEARNECEIMGINTQDDLNKARKIYEQIKD